MNEKSVDINRMTAQLRFWDAKLQTLEATAAQTGADPTADLQQQIEELRNKKQATQEELDKALKAGVESSSEGPPMCCAPGDLSGTCRITEDDG